MKRNPRKIAGYALIYIVWISVTIVTLLPVYWMIIVSGRSRVQLFDAPSLVLNSFYIQNYTNVINGVFGKYLTNSIVVATGNAILVLALALPATYALSRYPLRGKDNLFFTTLTQRMAPPAAFLVPLFLLFTQVFAIGEGRYRWDLFDTQIGLILLYCVFNLPFAIWLLKGIIDSIPPELDEAAFVDGSTTLGVLIKIIIPLAAPGLAVTFIFSWIFAWNEYLLAANLTSFDARTITTGLAGFVSVTGTNWGEMAAVATITIIPALLVVAFAQRYIVRGLTFGAVKD